MPSTQRSPIENDVDCSYWPGPITQQAHCSRARVKYLWGPLGTAKTSWLCWRVYYKAEEAAREGKSLRAILIRDTYRNLEDSTLKTWLHWFPDGRAGKLVSAKPCNYVLYAGGRTHEVLFRHGQTARDASDFLGTEYGLIGLEEIAPAYLPGKNQVVSPGIAEEVFDMALSRGARSARDIVPELALTSNPPSRTHWGSKRIIDVDPDRLARINWGHWFTPVSENIANLRAGYYQELTEGWPKILVRRFVQGERVDVFEGIPRFDLEKLDEMKSRAEKPGFRGFLVNAEDNFLKVTLEENKAGYVRIWEPPVLGEKYVIGGDVAEGVQDGDFSSAHVLKKATLEIVAKWHGRVEPEVFGRDELPKLGRLYNDALIGVENNNTGGGTTTLALKNTGYPRIFYHQNVETRGRKTEKIGWRTDAHTKPMMIDRLAGFLKDGGQIRDSETIDELMTFGFGENGQLAAQPGCHDDHVISLGIALQMEKHEGLERLYPALGGQQ